jgi:hypothetical protein
MGRIYEEAYFTIAAASASDSSQGLFAVRKPLPLVKVPYHSPDGPVDQVFAYIEPELDKDLSMGPLSDRAWVMQEYYLSRRTVHFTQNGLIWTCKDQTVRTRRYITSEFGDFWVRAFEDNWSALVSSYSRRQLTYKSDKLVALQGLQELFRQRTNKTYCYGLWVEDLPGDLFWYSDDKLVRDVGCNIPSWTWASTTGPISFKSSEFENADSANTRVEAAVSLTSGRLRVTCVMKLVADLRGPLECRAYCVEDLQDMDFTGRVHDEYKNASIHVSPTFLLISEQQQKIGWGVFDEFDRPPLTVQVSALCLLKQRTPECFPGSREQHFTWALLVQPLETEENTYQRVGWGLVLVVSCLDFNSLREVQLV